MKKPALTLLCLFAFGLLSAQNEGNVFFGAPSVHTIKFTFPYSNFTDSLTWSYTNDTYIKGDVEVDGILYTSCGVKWKGNSSYTVPGVKKSFKIDFNEFVSGQKHDGLKKLNLNNAFKDPSFLREKITLDFYIHKGVPGPRCTYTEVYINGSLWGFYTAVEEIDKTFLDQRFGEKKGNLFKGDPNGDLKWLGATHSNYYTKYELKTNETANDWTDLVHLIDIINNAPAGTYQTDLDSFFDTDTYLTAWATEILFANLDSYSGSGHNYYIYHDSTINKFRFIPWDVNEAFGEFNMGMTISQLEDLAITYIPAPASNRPLHQKMLANGYQPLLYDRVCDLINFDWSIWNLRDKIDSLANVIRPYVYADPNKFYSNANFETNIESDLTLGGPPPGGTFPGIKSFLTNRRESIAAEMSANGCVVSVSENGYNPQGIIVYPNPFEQFLQLRSEQNIQEFIITDVTGSVVLQKAVNNTSFEVYTGDLSKGVYILTVKNAKFETLMNKTLIKH